MNSLSVIQQIEQLPAVYLVEGKIELKIRVHVQQLDYVVGCEQVQAGNLPITRPHHRKCLTTASLSISKTGCLRAFESFRNERQDAFLVYSLIISIIVVSIIKGE